MSGYQDQTNVGGPMIFDVYLATAVVVTAVTLIMLAVERWINK